MLHEFLIHVDQGDHGKKATKTADQELLKERKSGDILVQDKGLWPVLTRSKICW